MRNLPSDLQGPVSVALTRAEESLAPPSSFPGGANFQPKWDGYRMAVVRDDQGAWLWSRRGKDLTDRFPDLAAAAVEQLEPGTVVDAEAVIRNGDRLDFDLPQCRTLAPPRRQAGWPA